LKGIEMTTDAYEKAAEDGFNTLISLWDKAQPFYADNGGCFWMCANTLHVALDYLIAAVKPDTYNLIEDAFKLFDQKLLDAKIDFKDPTTWKTGGYWVDDYGWWGIALTKAYIFAQTLGYNDLKDKLQTYATNCWIGMHTAWDPSPMENTDPNVHISGGIWNCNHCPGVTLAGRNCVTNEVYWLLSHLASATFGSKFNDSNSNEAVWFHQAKANNVLFDANNLVLERFKGTGGYPGYTWLGDQGLFSTGCVINSDSNAPDLNLALAEATIKAVKDHKTTNDVLSEARFSDSTFNLDYAGGKGIFIRNLGYLNYDSHASGMGPTYDDWIQTNASAVLKNQLPTGYFPYWWAKEKHEPTDWGSYPADVVNAVLQASGQSALTACIHP
jgi:hypothetical protein